MEYLGSLLIVGLTMAGLGAWVRPASLGARMLVGGALVTLALFLGNYVAGLPLRVTAMASAAAALAGLAAVALRRRTAVDWTGIAIHPVVVLPVLFVAVSLFSPYSGYTVFAGDAYGNWLVWAREAWWFDTIRRPDMLWRNLAYTQGWPTTMIYPQFFYASFDLGRSLIVIFLWHVALLGVVYDLVVRMMDGLGEFTLVVRRAAAWISVLVLLAAEATWTLLPQLLLIEKPQIYLMSGILCLAGLCAIEGRAIRANCLAIGILMAGAYLLKVTTLGFVPAVLLIACLLPFRGAARPVAGELAVRLALMLGPVIAVYALWNGLLPFARTSGCIADPFAVFEAAAGGNGDSALFRSEFLGRVGAYLRAFKLPLTVLSVAGLALAFRDRRLAVMAAPLVLFTIIYLASLYVLYALCFGGYEREHFNSLQRYLRIPLRMIHLFGLLAVIFAAVPFLDRAARLIGHGWWRRAALPGLAALAIAALTGYQARALADAMRNVAIRDRGGREYVSALRTLADDAVRLRALIAREGLDQPKVTLIAQGGTGFERDFARYESLKNRRDGHLNWYRIASGYSWGPARSNIWMRESGADQLKAQFAAQDILWPYRVDDWIAEILEDLTGDPACARSATRYLLVRTGRTDPVMRCVAKDAITVRDSRK